MFDQGHSQPQAAECDIRGRPVGIGLLDPTGLGVLVGALNPAKAVGGDVRARGVVAAVGAPEGCRRTLVVVDRRCPLNAGKRRGMSGNVKPRYPPDTLTPVP